MRTGYWRLAGICVCGCWLLSCADRSSDHSRLSAFGPDRGHRLTTSTVIGDVPLADNSNLDLGYPGVGSGMPEVLISRDQLVLSYNSDRRQINWAAWALDTSHIGTAKRQDKFVQDADLEQYLVQNGLGHAVKATEFQGSCFDRGHQVPSGDRTDTVANNQETFVMSNMVPQTAHLNRTTWEHLEAYLRQQVTANDSTLYIFAGPIFSDSPGAIGPAGNIAVPEKEFKIAVQVTGKNARPDVLAAVIMPNLTSTGTDPLDDMTQECDDQGKTMPNSGLQASTDWQQFETTVDDVAQQSGIDFGFLEAAK